MVNRGKIELPTNREVKGSTAMPGDAEATKIIPILIGSEKLNQLVNSKRYRSFIAANNPVCFVLYLET